MRLKKISRTGGPSASPMPFPPMRLPHLPIRWISLLLLVAFGLHGCSSASRRPSRLAPQALLFARSTFFDDALLAEATLGPFRLTPANGLDRTPPAPDEAEPIPVSRGTFDSRDERDAATGFPRGLGERGAFGNGDPARMRLPEGTEPELTQAGMPRQSLNVRFRSTATEPLSLRVIEIRSAIGNFVPVPEEFELPSGGVQALEPMHASYDAPIDELEVLVALRRKGATETKVLKLAPPPGRP